MNISVERGSTVLDISGPRIITLDTPVPVGQSFPVCSMRSPNVRTDQILYTATLQGEVSGNYTELAINNVSSSAITTVEWQVISGDVFTVQTRETVFSPGDPGDTVLTETVDAVDLNKTFVVLSARSPGLADAGSPNEAYVSANMADDTTLRMERSDAPDSGDLEVRAYVVEMDGANVQAGGFGISALANTDPISAVDLSQSFVVFSHRVLGSTVSGGPAFPTVYLSADNEVTGIRGQDAATVDLWVEYFVVSHPLIHVQSLLETTSGTTVTVPIDTVPVSQTATIQGMFGSGSYVDAGGSGNLANGVLVAHELSANDVTITRDEDNETVRVAIQVVEFGGLAPEDTQLLTVDSVVHGGNWTTDTGSTDPGDLATAIGGEDTNDETYARSEESPSASPMVWKFTNAQAPDSSTDPHVVTVRIRKDESGGDKIDLTLELREGYTSEASPGTLIASESFTDLSENIAESTLTLTQAESEAITDWAALYGRVVANVPS